MKNPRYTPHVMAARAITTLFLSQMAMLAVSMRIHFGRRGSKEKLDLHAEDDQ